MNALISPHFVELTDDYRESANAFIEFLYVRQQANNSDETASVIQDALRGEEIMGSFNTVEEMMEALDA